MTTKKIEDTKKKIATKTTKPTMKTATKTKTIELKCSMFSLVFQHELIVETVKQVFGTDLNHPNINKPIVDESRLSLLQTQLDVLDNLIEAYLKEFDAVQSHMRIASTAVYDSIVSKKPIPHRLRMMFIEGHARYRLMIDSHFLLSSLFRGNVNHLLQRSERFSENTCCKLLSRLPIDGSIEKFVSIVHGHLV